MSDPDRLFDIQEVEADPRLAVPELLGKQMGSFLGTTRWVTLVLASGQTGVYTNAAGEELITTNQEYAAGTSHRHEFNEWTHSKIDDTELQGYLAGFPILNDPKLPHPVRCLHIWANDESILDETFAVPLISLRGLYIHSKIRTGLQLELDHLSMGEDPSYELPLFRNTATNEWVCRPASADDILNTIEVIDDLPQAVFNGARTPSVARWLTPPNDLTKLQTLLDD